MSVLRGAVAFVVVLSFLGTAALPVAGSPSPPVDAGEAMSGPADAGQVWTDPLDDRSHVYVPSTGLVGVEVTGGQAQLLAGAVDGWIASEVIEARSGLRFDYVLLEAETPGGSRVEISILNASAEASEVGFANETIGGFRRVEGTDLSIYSVSPQTYPRLRLQVNLVADGADRPALKAWSLYFVEVHTWRDDFLGHGKMSDHRGINLTGGNLEINLSGKSAGHGPADYLPYPPVLSSGYTEGFNVLYPNEEGTGYGDYASLGETYYNEFALDDFNGDGYLDMACSAVSSPSAVFWGTGDGRFTTEGAIALSNSRAVGISAGDLNGDGFIDLALPNAASTATVSSVVFLNDGGTFDVEPDIVFTDKEYEGAAIGDLNNDGFDDVVFYSWYELDIYYGGSNGPDTTPDLSLDPATCRHVLVQDVNLDGYLDMLVNENPSAKPDLYLGSVDGLDLVIDQSFSIGGVLSYETKAGDLNGDGYVDLVFNLYESSNYKMKFFPGSYKGWSDSTVVVGPVFDYGQITVGDVDKDGYDDIVAAVGDGGTGYETLVYRGGTSWPQSPSIRKTGGANAAMGVAIPKASRMQAFRGTFTTMEITKPHDMRWDIAAVEGSLPRNTSVSMTILDDRGNVVQGMYDLVGTDLDLRLAGLPDTIRVKVVLVSELNDTTPVLDRLTVKWMDRWTWREQFYGPAKVDKVSGLSVAGGGLSGVAPGDAGPPILLASLRSDDGFDTGSWVYRDGGVLNYLSGAPETFETRGASAVVRADANGDGLVDLLFARRQSNDASFNALSPLYLGTPVGFRASPDVRFPTVGASAAVVDDLNGDGHADVVFSQELKGADDHAVNSTLFWGSASGWNGTPDVEFATRGASDVEAADLDGDGLVDLAFACYKDTSTATDSMVFLQTTSGFDGSSPDHRLLTKGARGVASGDFDGDGLVDLAFANSFSSGFAEIDSFVYKARSGGGFGTAQALLPTKGAVDVAAADVDGDGDVDLVFANGLDNMLDRAVDSYVYLNDGSGDFGSGPAASLPTVGASAVAVADIDGAGWRDLVFACMDDGTTFDVPSLVYLGGASGYGASADMVLPTVGASDVEVGELVVPGRGAYISRPILVEDPRGTGSYHTLRCEASLGPSHTARVMLVDADTWEELAGWTVEDGPNEWVVEGLFRFREHPSVRVMFTAEGLEGPAALRLDDLWLNWTDRVERPPVIADMGVSAPSVPRTGTVDLWLNITDEYDPLADLTITIQHRPSGTEDAWETHMLGSRELGEGVVTLEVTPRMSAATGPYDFRAFAVDSDGRESPVVEFPGLLDVINNPPTAPRVRISTSPALSTSTLWVEMVSSAHDVESTVLQYHYRWFKDGELEPGATGESLSPFYTSKGDNWTVEVRAFDGEDEGPPGVAWVVIENAPPAPKNVLPDPEMDEDTVDDEWIDLTDAFEDADDDPLTWSVRGQPEHVQVTIDHATGRVTFSPETDWFGDAQVTFLASDGMLTAEQTVTLTVHPVNDLPRIVSVNGEPVTGAPVTFRIGQGEVLVITYVVVDVEGHPLVAEVTTSSVTHDETAGTITFQPASDEVGTLSFTLRVHDTESPGEVVTLDFAITVDDVNDPMEDPRITSPVSGETFNVNQSLTLIALCEDPDVPFGQVLNFTWESNVSGLLGYGSSLLVSFQSPGWHRITVTVRDPGFSKTDSIDVYIKPGSVVTPPPPPDDDLGPRGLNWVPWVLLVAVLVVFAVAFFVFGTRRRTEELEEADEEEYRREHMTRAYLAVKDAADALENGRGQSPLVGEDAWEETGAGSVEVVSPELQLSMQATVTEEMSGDTAKLWAGVVGSARDDEVDREALRLENMKRRYQNAIGRLPYGIPSRELAGRDWVELAHLLATGEKRTVEGGREVTSIDGRWYYSDHEDTGSFLKEHGAKPDKATARGAVATGKGALLAKLEERFILGEITEETYRELKEKYGME